MKYTLVLFISFLSAAHHLLAQPNLPVIRATSKNVAINDGGFFEKNAWNLAPAARPDIYIADRTRKAKWVTFYTDIDSIRVKIKPGAKFDFIILLNGKDSCYTRIASAISPEQMTTRSQAATHDTIPFTLTAYNAIQVQSIVNGTDTLNLHFDASSSDFDLTKEAILKKTQLLSNQPDALAGEVTPNYNKLNKVVTIQIGNLVWNTPRVKLTGLTSRGMDGRIGWNVFEGKKVEIDYDHQVLVVHSQLPKRLKGYARSKMLFIRSYPCVKATFAIKDKKYAGNFMLDNGSDQAVILDSAWAASNHFSENLRLIKSTVLHDARGVTYETRIVMAPPMTIDKFRLTNIPTFILPSRNPTGFEINFLGNDLMKRFNIILDFKTDYVYWKPNQLMNLPYRSAS